MGGLKENRGIKKNKSVKMSSLGPRGYVRFINIRSASVESGLQVEQKVGSDSMCKNDQS